MKKNAKMYETVAALMAPGKGILAADESDASAGKRLEMVHLPNEPANRQVFRELLFTTPNIEDYLSGVIMFNSTIVCDTDDGLAYPDILISKGIIPGIKVDKGVVELDNFNGETVTQGLDDLEARFRDYYDLGARFAKWRAVVNIGDKTPTDASLEMNAMMMVRYAQIAQRCGIVPIVEPEVIFAGNHDLARAEMVTTRALQVLFTKLRMFEVDLSALILKSSMVLAGDAYSDQTSPEEVAGATLRTFHMSVPYDVGGIVFLSGGQTPRRSVENLNAIAKMGKQPWPITYSFSRALEEPFLLAWQGKEENEEEAQKMLLHACKMSSLAQQGRYDGSKDGKLK